MRFYFQVIFIFILVCLHVVQAKAQQARLDSINQLLDQTTRNNTYKVKTLILMAKELQTKSTYKSLLYAQQALLIAERLAYKKGISDALYYIANAYYELHNYPKSLEYYFKATKFYKNVNNITGEAITLRKIGHIYYDFADYEKSLEYHLDALKIYEKQDNQAGIAASLGDIGMIYSVSGDYSRALETYGKSLTIAQKLHDNKILGVNLNHIGEVYEKTQNHRKALDYYKKAKNMFEQISSKEDIANSLNGIGDVYKKTGRSNDALTSYLSALEIQKEINSERGISYSYMGIADLYIETANYKRAIDYLSKSLKIAKESEYKELIRGGYKKLSLTYEKEGNITKALSYYKLFQAYNDSIFSESRLELIAEMQTRFDFETKEKENQSQRQQIAWLGETKKAKEEELQQEKKIRQYQGFILIISFIVITIITTLSILLYRGRVKIRKANNQLRERNQEISKNKTELEKKSEELIRAFIKITDSIRYAETIQKSILPDQIKLIEVLTDYFVISRAKEIVSGDFYWVFKAGEKTFVAVVDCTGHGVSGGFMSMIGHTLLNDIVNQGKIYNPAIILEQLNKGLIGIVGKQDEEHIIGMEVCMCMIEPMSDNDKYVKLTYGGAKRPLFVIRNNSTSMEGQEIQEFRGDRQPIGFVRDSTRKYTSKELILEKGSLIYLTSDGFIDQANPNNKRFGTPRLKRVLEENAHKELSEQKTCIQKELKEYKKNISQRDDITIMGVRV